MAYSDYGAFVYWNGKRMKRCEDCASRGRYVHGLIGDGNIRVECYKQGLPRIYKNNQEIKYYNDEEIDCFDFKPFDYELDGYKFHFENYKPYVVEMKCPNGDEWRCEYDFMYGAGFE